MYMYHGERTYLVGLLSYHETIAIDSVPATLILASCFLYSLVSKSRPDCRGYPMTINRFF